MNKLGAILSPLKWHGIFEHAALHVRVAFFIECPTLVLVVSLGSLITI